MSREPKRETRIHARVCVHSRRQRGLLNRIFIARSRAPPWIFIYVLSAQIKTDALRCHTVDVSTTDTTHTL